MIVEAERKKRAAILESQGRKQAEINIAEGQRAARILSSGKEILRTYSICIFQRYFQKRMFCDLQRLTSKKKSIELTVTLLPSSRGLRHTPSHWRY
jgi:hypothetical protein